MNKGPQQSGIPFMCWKKKRFMNMVGLVTFEQNTAVVFGDRGT